MDVTMLAAAILIALSGLGDGIAISEAGSERKEEAIILQTIETAEATQ